MKVLVVNTVPTEKNGVTNVIFNYLETIDHQNIQMDVLMINDADSSYKERVSRCGGKSFFIKRTSTHILSYLKKLIQLIKKERYDAIHIHGNSHTMVLELLAAKIANCNVRITHSHNTTCSNVTFHKLLTPLFNCLYTNGFACGEDAGIWLYGKKPFTIINNGIDTNRFAFNLDSRISIRRKHQISDEEILIGNVGHFWGGVKNQAFVVKVFRELFKKDNRYRLCLIGDGSTRATIEETVGEYGLKEQVIFTGNINNVNEYLNALDLILMPSIYEGLPLTLVEQQANGLRCIVSDAITKEADKSGNISFVSLSNDASQWASIIEKTKTDTNHERKLRSIAAISRIKIEGYSIQEESKKLLNYYRTFIGDRG